MLNRQMFNQLNTQRTLSNDAWNIVSKTSSWQKICTLWWGKLDLDDDSGCIALGAELGTVTTRGGRLFVPDEYRMLPPRIMDYQQRNRYGGALVLGEEGTGVCSVLLMLGRIQANRHLGKSHFLVYLLIRLLMLKTDVVFTFRDQTMLFYQGYVYYARSLGLSDEDIPSTVIWSLIDIDERPSHALVHSVLSANASHSGRNADLWGLPQMYIMPLWTQTELLDLYVPHDATITASD